MLLLIAGIYIEDTWLQELKNMWQEWETNSDQNQIFPYHINAYSTPEIVRIKYMMTQDEFS